MDSTLTQPTQKTDAEYEAEFYEIMAEIRQHEATFDKLQAEIEQLRAEGERSAARGDAAQKEIDRMIQKLWGAR